MCLAIPGKILSIEKTDENLMADVSFGGIIRNVSLQFLPDAQPGEYVMVHVGFAISKVDEKEAEETIRMINELENNI